MNSSGVDHCSSNTCLNPKSVSFGQFDDFCAFYYAFIVFFSVVYAIYGITL